MRLGQASLLILSLLLAGRSYAASPTFTTYAGMCDASGAVALDANTFAASSDEENIIRIYHTDQSGGPIKELNLADFLKVEWDDPEVDIESAARLGNHVFWMGSHSLSKNAKARPNRKRFFSTEISGVGDTLDVAVYGKPYTKLMKDLVKEPRLKSYALEEASKKAPKTPDAFNIEGLTATPEGHLLIGFRNPIPHEAALLVPMLNPEEVIQGKTAKFGDPIELKLGGLGIRDIAMWKDGYLILAGTFKDAATSQFYHWAGGKSEPQLIPNVIPASANPESIVVYPDRNDRVQLLTEDSLVKTGNYTCKSLTNSNEMHFRGFWVKIPDLQAKGN